MEMSLNLIENHGQTKKSKRINKKNVAEAMTQIAEINEVWKHMVRIYASIIDIV